MKKVIATLAAMAIALGCAYAQDLAQVTEIYNAGVEAYSGGDYTSALTSFEKALAMVKEAGDQSEEATTILNNCKNYIPSLNLSIAKKFANSSNYADALTKLADAVKTAKEYGAEDVAAEAESLIPQVTSTKLMSEGNALLAAKDYAGAAAAYKSILDTDATNANAALRLGQVLNATGDYAGAKAAFETAAANGQEEVANKQIGNITLKEAVAALKAKKYTEAVEAALKVNDYVENSQAYQIAGQASQLGGKTNDAIKYFSQYLEMAPTAKNAGQIAYTIGALYMQNKNNAKAKEYFQKAVASGYADAQKMLDALK